MKLTLSRTDVERFRAAICRRFGLHFDDTKLEFLEELLRSRLAALRHADAHDYLASSWGRDEMHALAQVLTVPETYFFRNHEQFRALEETVVPHFIGRTGAPRQLRVLSAACASGEETYSLAISIRDRLPDDWAMSVTGIDINPAVLEKARAGRYSEWSLRGTDEELRERHFDHRGSEFILHDRIRRLVTFEERNLIEEDAAFWRPNSLDVVFCRNVTMYFPNELTQHVVARIARALVPGGYLFMGHAETLRGISNDFHLRHTHDTFYYQLKSSDEERAAPVVRFVPIRELRTPSPLPAVLDQDISWIDAIGQAHERIASLTEAHGSNAPASNAIASSHSPALELSVALELLRAERFTEAMDALAKLPPESQLDTDVQLLRAVLLANSSRLTDAESICNQMLALDEMNAGAHYVAALCREHAGDLTRAREHNQAAAYLNSSFAMPRLHLGLVAKRSGDHDTARHELDTARSLLRSEDASRILLFGGGFGREGLIELCNAELRALGE